MKLDLKAIQERCEKASPGPWQWKWPYEFARYEILANNEDKKIMDDGSAGAEYAPAITSESPDGQFIAHARADIPVLLEFAKEAKAALEKIGSGFFCREAGRHEDYAQSVLAKYFEVKNET